MTHSHILGFFSDPSSLNMKHPNLLFLTNPTKEYIKSSGKLILVLQTIKWQKEFCFEVSYLSSPVHRMMLAKHYKALDKDIQKSDSVKPLLNLAVVLCCKQLKVSLELNHMASNSPAAFFSTAYRMKRI